jgi:GNAT superfamily N-acetyltransferase
LLLGLTERLVAGTVALRPMSIDLGEIRRLYVRPAVRGQGVGRALMVALINEARSAGYRDLRLETLEAMSEARELYRSLGFREVPPWRPPSTDHDRTVSMALVL